MFPNIITTWLIECITHDDKVTDVLVFGYQKGVTPPLSEGELDPPR